MSTVTSNEEAEIDLSPPGHTFSWEIPESVFLEGRGSPCYPVFQKM